MILAGGLFAYSKMQTALFPEITFPKIKIIADAGQQPVDQMTVAVTRPLENAIKQVPDLIMIRSTTSRGSCEISAFMDWKADINLSQQQIESKINQIRNLLPADIQLTIEKMNPSTLPVIGYSLVSNTRSPIELKQLALYTIKPFLSQVEGTSDIRIIGGKSKEYWVILDQEKMSRLALNQDAVSAALNETNFVRSNGYLSDYRLLFLSLTNAQLTNKKQLEEVVIKNDGKRITQLKDIGKIEIREAKEYIKVNADGRESILIAVIKQPNSNLIDLSTRMESKLAELKKSLPHDVSIEPYYVQADFVNDAVKSVTDSLLIGLVLAIVVAIFFLKSWKASLTILITIPVTLGLTMLVLRSIGQTINIMTLGAIAAAIGLIIDDAIVIIEQIHRVQEEQPRDSIRTIIHKAIHYLLKGMIGSSISTIVIFLPFILMSGVAGAYFKVMTDTMIITLLCSFFATWLLLPIIYLTILGNKERSKKETKHEVKERKWVGYLIAKPIYSISFILILIIAIVVILPKLETGFLPEMDEGSIVLDYSSPPGTTLEETDRILIEVEKIITKIPEVQAYSRRTGTQMGFFITEPNHGDYLIQLKKKRNKSTNAVIDEIRTKVEGSQPALRIDFGQVIGDMLGDLMSSVQPIEIKIFGADQKKIQAYARQISEIISNIKGIADVFDGIVIAGPSMVIHPDFRKLAQYNITPTNFQNQLQANLEGTIAGNIFDQYDLRPIRLIYPNSYKTSISDLKSGSIFLPSGKLKPLEEFATITLNEGDTELNREDLQSMGVVTSRLDNLDLGSAMKEIQNAINQKVSLSKGYTIVYGGSYGEQQRSFKELLLILATSSLLVFLVILFLFKDVKVAFIILLIAILGISGSYTLLFLTHTPLNVGSYTGLIMVVGIVGENAIFTYLQYFESIKTMAKSQALVHAISIRLRPNLMTALGAIFALMPLALSIGTGSQLHQPLAIAVIGGFVVAIPLLLIVLPTMLNLIKPNLPVDEAIDS